jgi:hypothetical protein
MPRKIIFTTIATIAIATTALSPTAYARGGAAGHAGGFGGAHVGGFGGAHFGGAHLGGPMGIGHIGTVHLGADHVAGMRIGGDRIARGPAGNRVAHGLGRHFHRRNGFYGYFDGGLGDCSWLEYAQSNPWYCTAY